jgi:hypothetical protein
MENNIETREFVLFGKAKHDFETWLRNSKFGNSSYVSGICFVNSSASEFISLPIELQYSIIIEWLDIVRLQLTIEVIQGGDMRVNVLNNKFNTEWIDDRFEIRSDAMRAGIQSANTIYNTRVAN